MLHTARLLRLEPCEDRSLPSVPTPTPHTPVDSPAHVSSPSNPVEPDEDTEYANPAKAGETTTNQPALVPDYVIAAYPAAPPMPTVAMAPTLPVIAAPALPASIP